MFPFTKTKACDIYCANLKSCFFLSIAFLITLTVHWPSPSLGKPPPTLFQTSRRRSQRQLRRCPFFGQMIGAFKELQRPMLVLLLVTCLNWIVWFPFLLFNPDWMGNEVYSGQVGKGRLYDLGVRAGSLGLLSNSVILRFMSLGVEHLGRWVGGVKRLWAVVKFLLAVYMALTVLITKLAEASRHGHIGVELPLPPAGIKAGALSLFAVLGIPLAIFFRQKKKEQIFTWELANGGSRK
ncbi:hypothetical protein ACFXTO_009184 [Malus domestica]